MKDAPSCPYVLLFRVRSDNEFHVAEFGTRERAMVFLNDGKMSGEILKWKLLYMVDFGGDLSVKFVS